MSSVDIFYIALVLFAISGFAIALAYFSHQDHKFRAGRQRAEQNAAKPAAKPVQPKTPVTAKVLEHA